MTKILKRLAPYVIQSKAEFSGVLLFALLGGGAALAAPYVLGKAIDQVTSKGNVNFSGLVPLIFLLLALWVINAVSNWLVNVFSIHIGNTAVKTMREEGFAKITSLPVAYFDNARKGDLISRFSNDMELVGEGFLQSLTQIFTGTVSIIGSLVIMVMLNGGIGLAVVVVAPLAVFVGSFIAKKSAKHFRRQQNLMGEYNDCVEEYVSHYNVAKIFGMEERTEENASAINGELRVCGQKAHFYSALVNPSTRFVNNMAYVLVGLIGGLAGVAGRLTPGQIASLLAYSTQFAKPLNETSAILSNLQGAIAAAERFFMLLDESDQPSDASFSPIGEVTGKVEFRDLSFSYVKGRSLIEDFSVSIPPGFTVAIVGPTGAGKTTIVNLLMRFYDWDGGGIYIDGKDISRVTRDGLRLNFGMVLQDVWLFNGTVRDNIAFGRENASMEEIVAAAQTARAHDFIMRLDKNYDTVISPESSSLSQGEKQLLTIARAMLLNPPMMILDEATSSVDPLTEIYIQEALNRLMENKTAFVIAHRLSTIVNSDMILVMDKGRIVEKGSHEELLGNGGLYEKLYKSGFTPV